MSKVLREFDKSPASMRELAASVGIQLGITIGQNCQRDFFFWGGDCTTTTTRKKCNSRSTSAGDLEDGFPACLPVACGDDLPVGPSFEQNRF